MTQVRLACLLSTFVAGRGRLLKSYTSTARARSPATPTFSRSRPLGCRLLWPFRTLNPAGEHLKIPTAEPSSGRALSPEDHKIALYVADKFKAKGLQDGDRVEYRALLNKPIKIVIEAFDEHGKQIYV